MNIHEYQGKEILSSFGVTVQRGTVATTPQEAVEAAKDLTENRNRMARDQSSGTCRRPW